MESIKQLQAKNWKKERERQDKIDDAAAVAREKQELADASAFFIDLKDVIDDCIEFMVRGGAKPDVIAKHDERNRKRFYIATPGYFQRLRSIDLEDTGGWKSLKRRCASSKAKIVLSGSFIEFELDNSLY